MKKTGFVGLGRMGSNMVLNLLSKKYKVVVYNRSPESTRRIAKKRGVVPTFDLKEFTGEISRPRIIWMMIKSGKPVDDAIKSLLPWLDGGDVIIDGGNSFFSDSQRRHEALKSKGIGFLDCGVSGGLEGARHGASMTIGGDKKVFLKSESLFRDLSVKGGYGHVGKSGAGHFAKTIHNGIEYGMTGSIAEGFEALEKCRKKFGLDVKETARIYGRGSIISGRLITHLNDVFEKSGRLKKISCHVPKGETEDAIKEIEKISEMPVIRQARLERAGTRTGEKDFCGRIISALRNQFGGHEFFRKREP